MPALCVLVLHWLLTQKHATPMHRRPSPPRDEVAHTAMLMNQSLENSHIGVELPQTASQHIQPPAGIAAAQRHLESLRQDGRRRVQRWDRMLNVLRCMPNSACNTVWGHCMQCIASAFIHVRTALQRFKRAHRDLLLRFFVAEETCVLAQGYHFAYRGDVVP